MGLALSHDLPFTGLRGFEVDARLWHYVPLAVALRERLVPLSLIGDELKLACSRPDPDLTALERHFPYLRLGVVIAAEDEIDDVLARAEGAPDA